jgi:hypothetical protein
LEEGASRGSEKTMKLTPKNEIEPHRPKLVSIGTEHLSILRYILSRVERKDLYSVSPAYYAMTGRKGLWLYGDEGRGMMIARHPNLENTILFFPPFGTDSSELIDLALQDPELPEGKVKIARLSAEDDSDMLARLKTRPREEEILDWVYPVHMLNTEAVVSHEGKAFADFRNNLNRAGKLNIKHAFLDVEKHEETVRHIISCWAEMHVGNYSLEDLMLPTMRSLWLKRSSTLPINGIVVYEDDAPAGFILWEETRPTRRQASGLCNACISRSKGISEYTYLQMCKTLHQRGYSHVCVGGSEEQGLDFFKRKMAPEFSVSLLTLNLS